MTAKESATLSIGCGEVAICIAVGIKFGAWIGILLFGIVLLVEGIVAGVVEGRKAK